MNTAGPIRSPNDEENNMGKGNFRDKREKKKPKKDKAAKGKK